MIRTDRIEFMESKRKNDFPSWKCGYCGKRYETEKGFMEHKCKTKERIEQLKTPTGQLAYSLYSEWMKAQKRKAPSAETFSTSKLYSTFIKFADFVQGNNLLDTQFFIKYMVDKDMSPTLWMKETIFNMYMKEFDKNTDILELIAKSLIFLEQESERLEIPTSQIFHFLGIRGILSLIRARQISPAILFFSSQFKKILLNIDEDEEKALRGLINFSYWQNKLLENDDKTEEIKGYTKAFDL